MPNDADGERGAGVSAGLREQIQRALGGAFAVERELAAGATAHLFVATETALGRHVVLKVLPSGLSATIDAARFRREIELAARLAHPNIVPLLTAGEAAGFLYYTMPLVEGEALQARLQREGELPLSQVVSVLRDLARALAFAHAHGVVHRDVKPDNVLLEQDAALLTDFGIAKALSAAGAARADQTAPGLAVGTPAYVSPEQAAGDAQVDHRADLYSLGAVAYEMLTGQPPFTARTLRALLAAHRSEPPPPIAARREGLPAWLARLVMRLLEKHPADRPQSADEVLNLLDAAVTVSGESPARPDAAGAAKPASAGRAGWSRRRALVRTSLLATIVLTTALGARARRPAAHAQTAMVRTAPVFLSAHAVAVLPFATIVHDSLTGAVADGLTDELTSALGTVRGLRVASRTSVGALRSRGLTAVAVADSLRVGRVLEGTVERAGDRLLVSTQLTSAGDGMALWSATYERTARDPLTAQDEIVRAIVRAVAGLP